MKSAQWENWLNVGLGVWVMLSPWLFPSHLDAQVRMNRLFSDSIAGAIVFTVAALAVRDLSPRQEWVNILAGLWILAAPWILGYAAENGPFWNSVVVGTLIAIFAAFSLPAAKDRWKREFG